VWVFFVPIICQAAFPLFNKFKFINRASLPQSKHGILSRFVFSISGSIIIIGYVFFMGSILLIIPEDNPQTRTHPETFNDLDLEMYILGHILAIITSLLDRVKKYYKDKNYVQETEPKILSLANKISITCLLFSLSMSIFALHDIPLEKQHYYQQLTCNNDLFNRNLKIPVSRT
jgi:hypothetical protein